MQPIDTGIVIVFQMAWLVLVGFLLHKIFKLKHIISELRQALAPFARAYEAGDYNLEKENRYSILRYAFIIFVEKK